MRKIKTEERDDFILRRRRPQRSQGTRREVFFLFEEGGISKKGKWQGGTLIYCQWGKRFKKGKTEKGME